MPLRPGRSGEAGGRDSLGTLREEWRAISSPTQAGEPAELPSRSPPHPKPPPGHVGPGGIGKRPGRSGVAGGRGPLGGAGEERRAFAPPTWALGAC